MVKKKSVKKTSKKKVKKQNSKTDSDESFTLDELKEVVKEDKELYDELAKI